MKKKEHTGGPGPKRRIISFGPIPVTIVRLCGPALAVVGPRWPALVFVGLHWSSWAIVGLRLPALAVVDLRWSLLAVVGLH
jgi:hypothetical protein